MAGQKKDSSINQSPNCKCFKILISGYQLIPTGCVPQLQQWQLHKSQKKWQSGSVVLAEVPTCSDTAPALHIFPPDSGVLGKSRKRKGRHKWVFSVLVWVPLKRCDGHCAGVEIASVSFSTSDCLSERGVLDHVVQKSGIVRHPQAFFERSEVFILNMFVSNKKISKFRYLEDN